ncbi:hypothetical protein C8Q77DRAFT_345182 [Trametes polyzona]|nr:hypothetical protein C8Q77DRAFT_345182 [Trametes polyzona]
MTKSIWFLANQAAENCLQWAAGNSPGLRCLSGCVDGQLVPGRLNCGARGGRMRPAASFFWKELWKTEDTPRPAASWRDIERATTNLRLTQHRSHPVSRLASVGKTRGRALHLQGMWTFGSRGPICAQQDSDISKHRVHHWHVRSAVGAARSTEIFPLPDITRAPPVLSNNDVNPNQQQDTFERENSRALTGSHTKVGREHRGPSTVAIHLHIFIS